MDKVSLDLTDQEWMQLLDGDCEDSQLQACCANISALRDVLVGIVRRGRKEPLSSWEMQRLQQTMGWVADGHDLTPLLKKVCQQIGFDPAAQEGHEPLKEIT